MKVKFLFLCIMVLALASCGHKKDVTSHREYEPVRVVVNDIEKSKPKKKDKDVDLGSRIVAEAKKWIGVPYKYAGESHSGVDCSGMVMKVYVDATGIKLPRSSREQQQYCKKIDVGRLEPGDLVFFSSRAGGGKVSHVGIFIGDRRFIHASTSSGVIASSLDEMYYRKHFYSAGRVEALGSSKMPDKSVEDKKSGKTKQSTASERPGDAEARAIRDAVRNAF